MSSMKCKVFHKPNPQKSTKWTLFVQQFTIHILTQNSLNKFLQKNTHTLTLLIRKNSAKVFFGAFLLLIEFGFG